MKLVLAVDWCLVQRGGVSAGLHNWGQCATRYGTHHSTFMNLSIYLARHIQLGNSDVTRSPWGVFVWT